MLDYLFVAEILVISLHSVQGLALSLTFWVHLLLYQVNILMWINFTNKVKIMIPVGFDKQEIGLSSRKEN